MYRSCNHVAPMPIFSFIHQFLNPFIIVEITVFYKLYAVVDISQKILWNGNYSMKTVIFQKEL